MLSFCSRLCSHLCFLGRQVDKISALSCVNRSLCAYFMHARLKGNSRNPFFPLSKPVLFLPAPPGSRYGSWLQAQFVALFHRLRSSVWSSVYHMLQITTVTSLKRQGLFTSIVSLLDWPHICHLLNQPTGLMKTGFHIDRDSGMSSLLADKCIADMKTQVSQYRVVH